MSKRNRLVKIDEETHRELFNQSKDMSKEERKNVAMGEVIKRAIKSDEIKLRLIIGSRERRRLK